MITVTQQFVREICIAYLLHMRFLEAWCFWEDAFNDLFANISQVVPFRMQAGNFMSPKMRWSKQKCEK